VRRVVGAITAMSLGLLSSPVDAQRAGGLISADPVPGAPAGTQAWKIHYWARSATGKLQNVTGMVIAPGGAVPAQPRPVIAWTHGTSGVVSKCAPSLLPGFWEATDPLQAVQQGYVLVAPDYPGLGSPGPHPYLVGVPTARSVLDAVRAAGWIRAAAAGKRFAVWGLSQGGHAALWTGQLARSDAPDLQLVGVVADAPPTDLAGNLHAGGDPSIRAFLTAFTAYSWSRYYGAPLSSLGRKQTQDIITRLAQNNCVTLDAKPKLGTKIGILVLRQRLKNVDLGTLQPWAGYARQNSANAAAITVPLLIAQNPRDVIVAPAVTRQFARNACAIGKKVRWIDANGAGHQTTAKDTAAETIAWIGERFAGRPAPSDCGRF
jgi:acetyl esterase/lipase